MTVYKGARLVGEQEARLPRDTPTQARASRGRGISFLSPAGQDGVQLLILAPGALQPSVQTAGFTLGFLPLSPLLVLGLSCGLPSSPSLPVKPCLSEALQPCHHLQGSLPGPTMATIPWAPAGCGLWVAPGPYIARLILIIGPEL